MSSATSWRLLLVGTGGIAPRHVAALRRIPGTTIAGVCDLDRTKADRFLAQQNLSAPLFTEVAPALDSLRPDAVVLLTPRQVRLPVVSLCVERRIPLFMEKPPCHSVAVGEQIAALLAQSQLIHSVGFSHRYDPALAATLEKLAAEPLVAVQMTLTTPMASRPVVASYPDPYLVQRSGGLVGDQGIHYIDLARYISGAEVRTVRAVGTNRSLPLSPQVSTRDNVGWLLEMENNIVVTHLHTWGAAAWSCQIRLLTNRSDVTVDSYACRAKGTVAGQPFQFDVGAVGIVSQFEGEHRAFLEAIEAGDMSPVRSPYPDALVSFRLAEEINRQLYPS